jgi:phage/plasmid-associated DNA primase
LWDIETVKNLTGSDEIVVKELYKNVETIPVTWVYIILTNNYPDKFKQQDFAIADRLLTICFPKRFSDKVKKEGRYLRRKDDAKIEALKKNTAAIIQAFRLAFKEAAAKNFILEEPEKVKEVTDPIKQRADTIGYFLDACTEEDGGAVVSISALYQAYKKFVEEEDLGKPLSQRAFKDYLMTNNFRKQKINGLIHIVGLRLKDSGQPTPQGLLTNDEGSNGDGQDYLDEFPF